MSTSNALINVATLRNGLTGPVLGGITIPDFSIDASTPNQRVTFASTNPAGWNTGAGRMTLDFELQTSAFFSANPLAHMSVILRNTSSVISSAVRGQGMAFGSMTNGSDMVPTTLLETWMNGLSGSGAPADNFLWSNSEAARSLGVIDGQRYKFNIQATKTADGNRYLRYRMWSRQSSTQQWRSEVDTGDVLDHNIWADLTQQGLTFAYVFNSNLTAWSINIYNCKVIWGPAENAITDQTTKLSRYGAQLEGDLKFIGNSRTVRTVSDATNNWSTWTSFQTQGSNLATTVLAKPNGTATGSNFAAVNTSNPATSWQAAIFGMDGTQAVMQSYGNALSHPDLIFRQGPSQVAKLNTTGLYVGSATRAVGQPIASFYNFSNWGGYNAKAFTDSITFDMEAVSTVGTLAGLLGGTYSASNVESMIRPLYCITSAIVAELKTKGVL